MNGIIPWYKPMAQEDAHTATLLSRDGNAAGLSALMRSTKHREECLAVILGGILDHPDRYWKISSSQLFRVTSPSVLMAAMMVGNPGVGTMLQQEYITALLCLPADLCMCPTVECAWSGGCATGTFVQFFAVIITHVSVDLTFTAYQLRLANKQPIGRSIKVYTCPGLRKLTTKNYLGGALHIVPSVWAVPDWFPDWFDKHYAALWVNRA